MLLEKMLDGVPSHARNRVEATLVRQAKLVATSRVKVPVG